jgi:hypothetical protein
MMTHSQPCFKRVAAAFPHCDEVALLPKGDADHLAARLNASNQIFTYLLIGSLTDALQDQANDYALVLRCRRSMV